VEHHPSHFLLVLAVALINVALALVASEAAHRRADARLFLVSLALITSSGFLALHALATPGVLLDHPNSGFAIATPIGLLLASGFAAASAVELGRADAARILRRRTLIRGALAVLLIAWAIGSLAGVPFLDRPLEEEAPLACGCSHRSGSRCTRSPRGATCGSSGRGNGCSRCRSRSPSCCSPRR
jgi:hypothetical protein